MKHYLILSIFIFGSIKTFAQQNPEKEMKTEIHEVTVFQNSAQILSRGDIKIPKGNTKIIIKSLSPYIDDKSIQVKGEGDFTILSVNHKLNHLQGLLKDIKIDSLNNIIENLNDKIFIEESRIEVLKEKLSLLNENKKLGGQNTGTTLVQLKQAIEFYDSEISKIKNQELASRKIIIKLNIEKNNTEKQLKELHGQKDMPSGEIEVRVSAEVTVSGKFSITYIVSNAGWVPKYDARVRNIESPLNLQLKAEVYQNTGNDWNKVKLKFSNGDPNQNGVAPELHTWFLNFAKNTIYSKQVNYASDGGAFNQVSGYVRDRNGNALPGVNVLVRGTTIGTVTDVNGHFFLNLPYNNSGLIFSYIGYATQNIHVDNSVINVTLDEDIHALQEVVVTGYGVSGRAAGVQISRAKPISTTYVENQTTAEFEVNIPYTLLSNGDKLTIDLQQYSIPTLYEYYSVPKLDKNAYLLAKVINPDPYNLLNGEVNIYFEDGFVGKSVLNSNSLQDTLDISLGKDKNIVVAREKKDQYSKKKFIGLNTVDSREFNIIVRNKKSQSIKIIVFDQIPVSANSDIKINPIEVSKGKLNDQDGKIRWELAIDPHQQKELVLQYEVKYPRRERVILE